MFASRTLRHSKDARTLMQRLRDLEAQVADFMEPERKRDIGARLKEARENSPHEQQDLADAAGVKLRTYQFWEAGRGVNRAGVNAVAKKLRADPEYIWHGDGGASGQFDRIEDKMDEILSLLRAALPESVLQKLAVQAAEEGLAASRADKRAPASKAPAKPKRKAAA